VDLHEILGLGRLWIRL